jgi:hypothetical protein
MVKEQRYRIERLLRKNPGLEPQLDEAFDVSWFSAVQKAVKESSLEEDRFPEICPFAIAQMLDAHFWPDARG